MSISEKPFKIPSPPKVGYNKTIDPFPAYVNQGWKPSPTRHDKEEEGSKKLWKTTHNNNISHVSSSILSNQKNMRAEFALK